MDGGEWQRDGARANLRDVRRETYLKSLAAPFPEALALLRQQAKEDEIPLLREDTVRFLRFLLTLKKPKNLLEIGTATGYSTALLALYGEAGCHVTTIEMMPERICAAKKNWERAGLLSKITAYEGDALEVLPTLSGGFDFVLLDAAKGQYAAYLAAVKPLLSPGALIAADNVLQEDEILESRFLLERRNRTIHKRLRTFLKEVMQDADFVSDLLPIGDGLLLLVHQEA